MLLPAFPGRSLHRERLIGVVAPGRQRVMAPGALERAPGLLLVTVRHDDRGVQADHGHLAQIPPGHLRRRDAAVPRLDQVPYVTAGLRPGLADPGQGHSVASGQCPPRRRVRGDRAEQLALMAQRIDLADRRRAVGDRDGQVGEHPAPVMQRHRLAQYNRARRASAPDSAPVSPARSASSRVAADPMCDTTPWPPTSTSRPFDHAIESTGKVPLHPRYCEPRQSHYRR